MGDNGGTPAGGLQRRSTFSAIDGVIRQRLGASRHYRKCSGCGQPGLMRASCPELTGASRGCQVWSAGRANFLAVGEEPSQTVRVEMTVDEWKGWLRFKGMSPEAKSHSVASGVSTPTNCSYNHNDTPWLIDSGASRHMAGSYREFHDYVPEMSKHSVKLADGSAQAIMGSGTVMCNPNLSLSSVLHVPAFPINLMSISCITRELNCAAIFFPSWCMFQELGTGKKLGMGSLRDGLYYLDKEASPLVAAVLSPSPLEEFLLQHRRLGHMSFAILGVDCETGGDKGKEDDDAASRKMIIGVIPAGAEQEQNQGEQYDTSNEALRWPRPNEEREIQVYTRRRRTEKEQMQVLEPESETHGQHQEQEVDQQDDTQGQTNDTGPSSDSGPLPRDWQEAKSNPKWRAAMIEEMTALDKNNTWGMMMARSLG